MQTELKELASLREVDFTNGTFINLSEVVDLGVLKQALEVVKVADILPDWKRHIGYATWVGA